MLNEIKEILKCVKSSLKFIGGINMDGEKNSLIKFLWMFFTAFLVLIILSTTEWLYIYLSRYSYMNNYVEVIKTVFLVFGIVISAVLVEYITQYKIFENKDDKLSNMGANLIYLAIMIGYIMFYPISFGNKLMIVVSMLIFICLLRHSDYSTFKNLSNSK